MDETFLFYIAVAACIYSLGCSLVEIVRARRSGGRGGTRKSVMKFALLAVAWTAIMAFAYGKIFLGAAPFSGTIIFYAIVCLGVFSLAQVAVECFRAMRKRARNEFVLNFIKLIVLAAGWVSLLALLHNR